MAGQLKVDNINADSNLALKIANTAVAYIDSTGLKPVSGNLVLGGTQVVTNGAITANSIANSSFQTGSIENYSRAVGLIGMRNRVINGAMTIAQRGTSTTLNTTGIYSVDRYRSGSNGTWSSGVFTATQSTNAPAGFTNSLGITVTTADSSPASGVAYTLVQWIEGYNIADLGWGTADAKTVTLSFWVKSSLTGTFSGSLQGALSATRGYFFTYSIPVANTWTYVTVTIPGDGVAGVNAYGTTNNFGIGVRFSLGAGGTCLTSAGSWMSITTQDGVTGQTNVVATNGATWNVTGVQLEAGSTPTNFEYRHYGQELALCQRYYSTGRTYAQTYLWNVAANAADYFMASAYFKQSVRTAPTMVLTNNSTGTISTILSTTEMAAFKALGPFSAALDITWTASAEL